MWRKRKAARYEKRSFALAKRTLLDYYKLLFVAVAGFGVASKVEIFSIILALALSAGFAPFVGQNWEAKKKVGLRLYFLVKSRYF